MIRNSKRVLSLAVATALGTPLSVYATNGMNMEGYGPIATGMGGASMAYDNGTAALMNNPATLGLMESNSRLDVALGFLGPNVSSSMSAMPTADSSGDAYYMPAVGWTRRQGKFTYGVGMFAQGGMGTEYSKDSFLAAGTGDEVMSQVGVGRLLFPLVYNVDDKLTVGGSVDYVWAGMDMKMAIDSATFGGMAAQGLVQTNMDFTPFGAWTAARFDFADGSDFTQAAKGNGFAAKLGVVYKANEKLTLGATYHSKTSLSDLEAGADMSVYGATGQLASMHGDITVKDFEWPSTLGVGLAFQATDKWLVAADVKRINWSDTMANFKMGFTTAGGGYVDVTMPQDWDDQTVIQLGATYAVNRNLALRVGYNGASNPIPDETVNPLFPAIIERHYTLGFGYAFDDAQSVNFSLTYAPEVSVTSQSNIDITHSQTNWQMMYSHNF